MARSKAVAANASSCCTYSLGLEYALLELFGQDSSWAGLAGAFQDPKMVRKAVRAAVRKVRRQFAEVSTADARLQLIVGLKLDTIDRKAKQIGTDRDAFVEIVGELFHLVAYLLGFDWMRAETNRSVIYVQTHEQLRFDDARRYPKSAQPENQLEVDKRKDIVASLFDQGLRIPEIARVMQLSEANVKSFLMWAERIARSPKHGS